MPRFIQSLWLIIFLVLAPVLLVWISWQFSNSTTQKTQTFKGIDYQAEHIEITEFFPNGKTRYHLWAVHLTHTLPDAITRLHQVRLRFFPSHHPPITVLTPQANLLADHTHIDMPDKVTLQTQTNTGIVTLHTQAVMVNTQTQTAFTTRHALIQGTQFSTSGQGLHANLKNGLFILEHHIHSVYYEQTSKPKNQHRPNQTSTSSLTMRHGMQ